MAGTTRRRFAALAAISPLALSVELPAQTPPAQTPLPPPPAPPSKYAQATTDFVRSEFGAHLNDEELSRIRADFESWEPALKRLRDVPLVNSDEPDFSFTVKARR